MPCTVVVATVVVIRVMSMMQNAVGDIVSGKEGVKG